MTRVRSKVRYLAGRDGLAHAQRPGQPRTVCGVPAIGEAFAWPERDRCWTCVRMLAAEVPA